MLTETTGSSVHSWAPSPESLAALGSDPADLAYRRALEALLVRQAELNGNQPAQGSPSLIAQFQSFVFELIWEAYTSCQRGLRVADLCVYGLLRLLVIAFVIVTMVSLGVGLGVAAATSSPSSGFSDLVTHLWS